MLAHEIKQNPAKYNLTNKQETILSSVNKTVNRYLDQCEKTRQSKQKGPPPLKVKDFSILGITRGMFLIDPIYADSYRLNRCLNRYNYLHRLFTSKKIPEPAKPIEMEQKSASDKNIATFGWIESVKKFMDSSIDQNTCLNQFKNFKQRLAGEIPSYIEMYSNSSTPAVKVTASLLIQETLKKAEYRRCKLLSKKCGELKTLNERKESVVALIKKKEKIEETLRLLGFRVKKATLQRSMSSARVKPLKRKKIITRCATLRSRRIPEAVKEQYPKTYQRYLAIQRKLEANPRTSIKKTPVMQKRELDQQSLWIARQKVLIAKERLLCSIRKLQDFNQTAPKEQTKSPQPQQFPLNTQPNNKQKNKPPRHWITDMLSRMLARHLIKGLVTIATLVIVAGVKYTLPKIRTWLKVSD